MSESIFETFTDERGNISVRISQEVQVLTREEAERIEAEYRRMQADNAKLRELCADMWHVMWACAEQRCKHRENECYVVNGNNGALPSHDECWYKRRMRELGVIE